MLVLLAIGFVAGLLTIISPCILPVLPAVIASGVTAGGRRRALAIAAGLSMAFGLSALFSIRLLQALHLPLGLRYDIAIVVLFIVAAGLIVPRLGELVERPFARLGGNRGPKTDRGGLVLGASLGLLYLPCGGPILATIAAVGSPSSSIDARAVGLTAAYSLGIGLPVFWLVLAADRVAGATTWLRTHALATRRVGGALLAVSALAITFGAATSLQTAIPSYTAAVENHLTADRSIKAGLADIGNRHETVAAKRVQQSVTAPAAPAAPAAAPTDQVPTVSASSLKNYGPAPNFAKVTKWLNTPNGASLNLASLRGKVVLIDFWTYSCINCLRSLPHVKAWYSRYHSDGLDVIGVHTPEFDFEHVASNVTSAISRLGVTYPVAMDNDYGTWSAWGNNSWPAEYLIDAKGNVRYGSIGEGDYGQTEAAIRALLASDGAKLPATTAVPDATPQQQMSPESYLGYSRLARYEGAPAVVHDKPTTYSFASHLGSNQLSYSGQWTVGAENIKAGQDAKLRMNVSAADIYLVLSGTGTVTGTLGGKPLPVQHVSGVPTLYTIASGQATRSGTLALSVSPGVSAYDFTFG
jgi:cytochrome c biogenesis protein CcdA/thiol-disulfide isomerase/thioredoxin